MEYLRLKSGDTAARIACAVLDERIPANMPVIGVSMTLTIQRCSDGRYWDWTASEWDVVADWASLTADHKAAMTDEDTGWYSRTWDQATADSSADADYVAVFAIASGNYQGMAYALLQFRGNVALASKMEAYVQLLARSDAAIATDRATELGEINANEGSGAGDFANTADSQEAIRDNGLTLAGATGACTTAIGLADLDHLVKTSAGGADPTVGTYLDRMMNKDASQTHAQSTDSQEAAAEARTSFATSATQTTEAVSIILNRLGAWTGSARNTILGAFQALFRKDADATVPSDVNADLGSGAGAADNTTDSTEAIRDRGDAAWTGGGDGDTTVTVTCQVDGSTPIAGAKITVKDAEGTQVADPRTGRADGTAVFTLNVAVAHQILVSKLGQYTFAGSPFTLAIDATTLTATGVAFSPSAPAEPDTCAVYGWLLDKDGAVLGAEVRARPVNPPLYDATGQLFQSEEMSTTTVADGYWELPIPYSATIMEGGASTAHWEIICPSANLRKVCVIPSEASKAFDDLAAP